VNRVLLALVLWLLPGMAEAQDAAAQALFRQGRYADAAMLFEDPAWKAVAYYRSLQFLEAAELFAHGRDVWSLYNLGNSYARMSLFDDALKAYEAVLLLDPAHPDAKANAALMRELLTVEDRPDRPSDAGLSGLANDGAELAVEDATEAGGGDPPERGEREQEGGAEDVDAGDGDGAQARSAEVGGEGAGMASDDGERPETLQRPDAAEPTPPKHYREEDVLMSPGPEFVAERQASVAWLEEIREDPGEFLKRRLALERWRRRMAGTTPQQPEDPW